MKLTIQSVLIALLFFNPIGSGIGHGELIETNIYFFQEKNVTHLIFNSAILLVYYDSGDILCMVSHRKFYESLLRRGRLRLMMIYADTVQTGRFINQISKSDNIQIVDLALKLCFVIIKDKINYILNDPEYIMFRMINGFTCSVMIENCLPNNYFINPMGCTISVPAKDYDKLLKWVESRNVKRK